MTKSNSAFRFPLSAFLFFAAVLLTFFLGLNMPLVGPDEPRYSQVAREMFERGDWITPTLGGFNWFEKPALLYWLQIASYNVFGVSEFAARFGSALSGLGTVAALWVLGRHIERSHKLEGFASTLAIVAASTVSIIAFAHGASFDIILTFPITAALVSFYVYDSSGTKDRASIPLVLFYVFVGLALLAKGLIGVIIPFSVIGLYHLISFRRPGSSFILSLFWGGLITIVVASAWYLPMYLRHGYEFIDQFFIQHHFQRYTSNKYLHPQPFYFFLWVMPLMVIPWTPFFLAALWRFGREMFSGRSDAETGVSVPRSASVFAFCWLAVPVVFFSFSGSKLPGYILPAVPGAVVLTAVYLYRFTRRSDWRRFIVPAVAAGTFVIVIVATVFVAPSFAESDSVKQLFASAAERGLSTEPVMMLHGISHNAEFYSPGRIVRDVDGKQKRFPGPREVSEELNRRPNRRGLVIVPLEYLTQLLESEFMRSELIKENGDVAIVAVYGK